MNTQPSFFDLDPYYNWPDEAGFQIIWDLRKAGLIEELCPSETRWHFVVRDERAREILPPICFAFFS